MVRFYHPIRLLILILIEHGKRNWPLFSAGLVILIALFFLSTIGILKLRTNYLSQGMVGTYQQYDLPEITTRLLSQGLVEADQDGRIKPKLAASWEVNKDATVYKFKLKKNLRWTDSTFIKSADLQFAITDVEVSYPDDTTIQFKLKDSFTPLPSLLTKPVFKKGTLVGTGPYRLAKFETSRIFITKAVLHPLETSLPKLIIRFYPNEKILATAFAIGEVQSLLGVADTTPFVTPLVRTQQKITFSKVLTILYNTQDPLLSNRSLRQALSFSAPSIESELESKTPIPPYSWAYTKEVNDYLSNPEAAKTALARAKTAASDDLLQRPLILTAIPQFEGVAKQVVSNWQKLGLRADYRVESGIPQNFQALLIAQSIPVDPDQYSLWHSTQNKTNLTKYFSARVDKDLEDGRKLLEEAERKLKYVDFQKQLLEDAPATFLYFPKYNIVYLKKVENQLNQVLPLQLLR